MDELQKQILNRIDTLAAKLGTTADHLWTILVRQAKVEAITDIVWILLVTAATVLLYMGYRKVLERDSYDDDHWWLGLIFLSFADGVGIVFAIFALLQLPTVLFNPQYWALTQIVGK